MCNKSRCNQFQCRFSQVSEGGMRTPFVQTRILCDPRGGILAVPVAFIFIACINYWWAYTNSLWTSPQGDFLKSWFFIPELDDISSATFLPRESKVNPDFHFQLCSILINGWSSHIYILACNFTGFADMSTQLFHALQVKCSRTRWNLWCFWPLLLFSTRHCLVITSLQTSEGRLGA